MVGYRFGKFILDTGRQEVRTGDRPVGLPRKNFEVLQALVLAEGRLISRDELVRTVWPDTTVEEATLRQNIYLLRTMLREIDDGREYVETVPKAGYRLVAPVERIEPSAPRVRPRWWASAVAALLALTGLWVIKSQWAIAGSRTPDAAAITRQGWLLLDERDSNKFLAAETLFDDGLRIDPRSSDAHAGKAILFALESKESAAESEASEADALAPGSSYLKIVRGFDRMMYHWDWAAAGKLMSAPAGCAEPICRQWRALYLGLTGNTLNAVREAGDALELSSNASLAVRAQLSQLLYWDGQYDAAIRESKTVIAAGGASTHAREHEWKALVSKGDLRGAAEALMLAIEPAWYRLNPGDPFAELQSHPERMGTPEFWNHLLEIEARSRKQPYRLAAIAMAAGDRVRALNELEAALQSRDFFLPFARRDPIFAPLYNEPRYQAVMKAVGLAVN